MRHYLASWVVLLSAISCGGSSETADPSNAGGSSSGVSSGGNGHAGSATAGSAGKGSGGSSSGGSSSGGSSSAGSSNGGTGVSGSSGQGGTVTAGTSNAGTGPIDPDCPATRPMGACDDAGTSCQYDFTNCLCYPTPSGSFIPCQRVDPACTGAAQAAAPADGAGGVSAKIGLPPRQVCTCASGSWTCSFGI